MNFRKKIAEVLEDVKHKSLKQQVMPQPHEDIRDYMERIKTMTPEETAVRDEMLSKDNMMRHITRPDNEPFGGLDFDPLENVASYRQRILIRAQFIK